ncbi:MAG: UbiD family decarboxylase [Thermoprotei archaeon]
MNFGALAAWLKSNGLLNEVTNEKFLAELKKEDGNKAVMETCEGVKRIGNVILSRQQIALILNQPDIKALHERLVWAIRNPEPLRETEESSTEEVIESTVSSLNIPAYNGKPYITAAAVIAGNGRIFNSSFHRMLYLGAGKFAVRIVPRHLYKILEEARNSKDKLPVAAIIGGPLEYLFASSSSPPFGVFELEVANSLSGNTLKLKKSPEFLIPYPADSEIMLEGYIDPDELAPEGPFFDVLKTYDSVRAQPVFTVERLYRKKSAMFHVIYPGGIEHQLLMGLPKEAKIREAAQAVVPRVKDVYLTPAGGTWLHAAISISKQRDGDAKNVIMAAFGAHPSLKHVLIVDEDIDVYDPSQLEWALATRFRADRGLLIINKATGSTLDPSATLDGETTKVGIDATAPIREKDKYKRAD